MYRTDEHEEDERGATLSLLRQADEIAKLMPQRPAMQHQQPHYRGCPVMIRQQQELCL